ncbi:nuclear transport factor 2 family protein [Amycolatopsis taiwanensis]|uniref:Steroid Delta-isomerase n=1 Tax=Amycolatopsis taiwanensis TaxID=342230 RepID=A0A9W6QXC7_9PSEU|nr:nuclear transport factor 2 family protein [Amycolatopsis taiwanensis]GLY65463.1 steroid Delta-isomerase [Amycolatopsis taiwanensis]
MPTAEAITDAVRRYLKAVAGGTAADIAACFAENATLEDPVGSEPHRGRAAIQRFFEPITDARRETELIAIRVASSSAAFHFRVRTERDSQVVEVQPIDVMTFDETGLIVEMRAFWSEADIRLG